MKIDYLSDELKEKFLSQDRLTEQGKSSLGIAMSELEDIFKEDFPFQVQASTIGSNYIWTNAFIYKCLWAFATDSLEDMGDQEIELFTTFVEYEESMSFSLSNSVHSQSKIINKGMQVVNFGVPIGVNVIGCTLQDKYGKSYEIYENGKLGDECVRIGGDFKSEEVYASLDQVFMDMLNDVPNNQQKLPHGELIDMTNSIHDNVKDLKDVRPNT